MSIVNVYSMEQQFSTLSFIIIFLLFLLMIIMNQSKKSKNHKLPPSPSKLPIIGHLHHLLGLPHRTLRDLARIHGPIMYLQLGELPTVIVSSAGVAKQVMKTHDLMFVDRPNNLFGRIFLYDHTDIIFAPYGAYWRQLKKICITELLSTKRVQSFRSVREEETSNLITRISLMDGCKINLSEKISTLVVDIVARAAFGKTCQEKHAFVKAIDVAAQMGSSLTISDLFPSYKFLEVVGYKTKLDRLHKKIDNILNSIVKDHIENIKDVEDEEEDKDIVDVLLRIKEGGQLDFPITIENVKAVILDMFAAGTDTATTAIEWIFAELLKNSRVLTKAQDEVRSIFNGKKIFHADLNGLHYIRAVIKETLRLHPPAALLVPRVCREGCEIEGYEIPKGCQVIINAWAIGRDPEYWTNPEIFEPERFLGVDIDFKGTNFEFIPFGAGRRICPGIAFAVANIELAVALLLYHFNWKLADGVIPSELDMSEIFGAAVKRRDALYVIPTSYNQ